MSSSILILGASGFIGRHLCESIAKSGKPVIAATRSQAKFRQPGISNVVAPFDDPSHFSALLDGCDAVIHAASRSTPVSSAAQPQLDGNLKTTLALIEALQDAPSCRVIFLSSGGTLYGDRADPAREIDPLRPRSYHGAGKAAAEHFFHAWATQYDGTAILLRPSNIYGPGQSARNGFGIIPTAFNCALHAKPLTIFDGESIRDYLYIDDFVALCHRALVTPIDHGAWVFNAASGEGISLDTLVDHIDSVTGQTIERVYRPSRLVDIHRIVADPTAAQSQFDWFPSTSLEKGLRQTWHWFTTQA